MKIKNAPAVVDVVAGLFAAGHNKLSTIDAGTCMQQ